MPTNNRINSNFYEIAVTDVNGDVTGLNIGTLVVNTSANLGSNTNIRITGGSNGQVLTTNGAGGLSWTTASGGATIDDCIVFSIALGG